MWPFRKISEVSIKSDVMSEEISRLKKWREVGERFFYLERQMCVTAHHTIGFSGFTFFKIPSIQADYVDNNGVIRHIVFNMSECNALMENNPNGGL